ncbi:hypothetical protein [Micromonospora sp. IBHARD004]|uniref:hypothetical protein n=1 Tax=Micromonospora sp. IBHARD004 TaxID=3457764 RepID=UPI00405A312B
MRLRWASGGSVTTSGTQIDSILAPCNTGGLGFLAVLLAHVVFGVNVTITVGVSAVRNTGTGNLSSFGSSAQINKILVDGV